MRDPFKRASRRVIRRLGGFTPIDAQSDTGARIPNFKGIYENPQFHTHGKMKTGLFVNPDIDLRLFMAHWKFSFAVTEDTKSGLRKSLQFFDKSGAALHKIYIGNTVV